MIDNPDKYKFLRDWKEFMRNNIIREFPYLDDEEIDNELDEMIKEQCVNPECEIHNNYQHRKIKLNLLEVVNWMDRVKPIIGGFGCFYKNQNDEINPPAKMVDKFLTSRKEIKKLLKVYPPDSKEYADAERGQLTEKNNANSFYGAGGAPTSRFFNIYTAQSITATGQSLISTTETAFENMMENNNKFIDTDECIQYLYNILNEPWTMNSDFLENKTKEELITRLINNFKIPKKANLELISSYIDSLSQDEINRVYYKNNLYEFSSLKPIHKMLERILKKVESFKDPNKIPNNIKGDIEYLWNYYEEFVVYNHFVFNRINRLKNDTRMSVTTIDTDSNMVCLLKWVEYLQDTIIFKDDELLAKDPEEMIFTCVNMMAYYLTQMITKILNKYTEKSNILEEYRPRINMKNEFLFSKQILANAKKRYVTNQILREGKLLVPEKMDTKGFDFVKSSTSIETKKYYESLIKKYILYSDKIDIAAILRELQKFEKEIIDSLSRGEKKYLTPASANEIESYKKPFSQQQVLAVIAWNTACPNNTIQLPEKIMMAKVNLETEAKLEQLRTYNEEIYWNLKEGIFNSDIPQVKNKGVYIIAIPPNLTEVPDWITPFIDTATISNNVLNKFFPLLHSLGLRTFKTSKRSYPSNILNL